MSINVIAVLATLTAFLGVLAVALAAVAPLARRWIDANLTAKEVNDYRVFVRGAYDIVSQIAAATPGFPLDDGLAKVLGIAAREFELARGREPTLEELKRLEHITLSMHANPNVEGNLGQGDLRVVADALSAPLPRALGLGHSLEGEKRP